MKYVGIWWGMHINTMTWSSGPKHGATTANTKRYIDFAAANGLNEERAIGAFLHAARLATTQRTPKRTGGRWGRCRRRSLPTLTTSR